MSVPVLTYHSIGDESGPTNMPEDLFRAQLRVLSELGYRGIKLQEYMDWIRGKTPLSPRSVLITFDDAFDDFAKLAAPALLEYGFGACVFVPTGRLGLAENWFGSNRPPKPLFSSSTACELKDAGFDLGSHSVSHRNLTQLDDDQLEHELRDSAATLTSLTGEPVAAFAPPYGASNQHVRAAVSQHYECSFGVELACSRRDSDTFDIPRIEMHYFRDESRFRAFLGGSRAYFKIRRLGRYLNSLMPVRDPLTQESRSGE